MSIHFSRTPYKVGFCLKESQPFVNLLWQPLGKNLRPIFVDAATRIGHRLVSSASIKVPFLSCHFLLFGVHGLTLSPLWVHDVDGFDLLVHRFPLLGRYFRQGPKSCEPLICSLGNPVSPDSAWYENVTFGAAKNKRNPNSASFLLAG